MNEQNVPEPKILYLCNPELNTPCTKTCCYINGGVCRETTHLEYAKQPVINCRMILPMSDKEAEELIKDD